jgi:hypothetical protein
MSKDMFVSEAEFRRLLAAEVEFTKKLVQDQRPVSLLPRFAVTGVRAEGQPRETRVFGLDVSLNDSEEKRRLFEGLGARCYAEQFCPLAAFVTTEAWLSTQTEVQPRQDPKRQEAVVISGRTIDGRDCLALAPVFRDTGDVIRLGKFDGGPGQSESLLLNAFFGSFMRVAFGDLKGKGSL